MGIDLCPVIEDLTSPYLAYLDLLDLFRHQVLAQEVFVHDLTSRFSIIDEVVDHPEGSDEQKPVLWFRVHLRIKEEALYFVSDIFTEVSFLFAAVFCRRSRSLPWLVRYCWKTTRQPA